MKFVHDVSSFRPVLSLPARGVWIEIDLTAFDFVPDVVTPRKGSVD